MFYQVKLAVFCKNICCTLNTNANSVKRKIRKKIITYWFFILYNNINFIKYKYNTYIFN